MSGPGRRIYLGTPGRGIRCRHRVTTRSAHAATALAAAALISACEGSAPATPATSTTSEAPLVLGRLEAAVGPSLALDDEVTAPPVAQVEAAPSPRDDAAIAGAGPLTRGAAEGPLRFRFADEAAADAPSIDDASAPPRSQTAPPVVTGNSTTPPPLVSGPAAPRYVAMAREIQTQVSCLRGRPFTEDVNVEFQSIEDFTAFVHAEIDRETKTARGRREARMLKALGFIGFEDDLGDIFERATVEQAAAYYDPKQNTFFIVKQMPDFMLRATMAHELQHALQDQHSSTLDDYTQGRFETHDAALAARFVVEGEASLVGNAWTMMAAGDLPLLGGVVPSPCGDGPTGDEDRRLFWSSLRDMNVKLAGQTRSQVQNPGLMERMLTRALSPSVADSMATLGDLPNYVYFTLVMPYTFGGYAMYEALERDRYTWPGVDDMFASLPQTTAQLLHPRREVTGVPTTPSLWEPADHPFDVRGWRADPVDRLGELALRIWLIDGGMAERAAASVASGWSADAVRVWSQQRAGAPTLAYDLNLHARTPAQAEVLKTAVFDALEHRRGELELIGEVSALADAAGVISYAYDGPRGRRAFGRLAWSPRGLVLSEGWNEGPRAPVARKTRTRPRRRRSRRR